MFDLKDAAVFMLLHIYIYIYLTSNGFGEVNVIKIVNENFVQYGFCLQRERFCACHTLSVFLTVHCKIKF